jgi:hypothetical protein
MARKDFTKCRRSDSPAFRHLDGHTSFQSSRNLPTAPEAGRALSVSVDNNS